MADELAAGGRAKQIIDLSGPNRLGRDVEIITPGGVITVAADMVTTQEGLPRVVIEVAPSTREMPTSGDGGHWETGQRIWRDRTTVTLTRTGDI